MKKNISRKKLREFGLLLGFTIPFLFGFLLPAFSAHVFKIWTIWAGVVFLTFSVANPNLLLYPYRVWMFIGYFLGLINSRIILGVVFLVVLLPILVLMRL